MKFERQLIHQQHLRLAVTFHSPETIQELQNAMELDQQHVHKKQVKTLATMEGRFEHDPSMVRDRSATVVPQSLTCQVRSHPL